jgi:hypothetical protein
VCGGGGGGVRNFKVILSKLLLENWIQSYIHLKYKCLSDSYAFKLY